MTVSDESGAALTGLAGSLLTTTEPSVGTVTYVESTTLGVYLATVSVTATGTYSVSVEATDERGIIGSGTTQFLVEEESAPDVSTKFSPGDTIKTVRALNVRIDPSFDGTDINRIGRVGGKSTGTILGGPVWADGYWWWFIEWDNYTFSDGSSSGWSVENWLKKT